MSERDALFLPLLPEWADMILEEKKDVEIRRIMPGRLEIGDTVLLYETRRKRAIVGIAEVDTLSDGTAEYLLRSIRPDRAGMQQEELIQYLKGAKHPGAIGLRNVHRIYRIKLEDIRAKWPMFAVPQSFRYVKAEMVEQLRIERMLQ